MSAKVPKRDRNEWRNNAASSSEWFTARDYSQELKSQFAYGMRDMPLCSSQPKPVAHACFNYDQLLQRKSAQEAFGFDPWDGHGILHKKRAGF